MRGFVDPVNDLLGFAGGDPLPDSFVEALLAGYRLTNEVDAYLVDLLGLDAVFNGEPLISLAPMLDAAAVVFEILNLLGA